MNSARFALPHGNLQKKRKLFWKIVSLNKSSLINATDLDNCKADDDFHKEKIKSSDDVASYDQVL